MRHQLAFVVALTITLSAVAQDTITSKPSNTVSMPTVMSVGDIMVNYGLDTLWLKDTSYLATYLEEQPQDYVALTNLCVSIRTKAQKAMSSIEHDYEFRDSLIWIDSNTILADYPIYEQRLRMVVEMMSQRGTRYARMEQQRIEAEKEAARRRAIEEARRKQEALNETAADLRSNIDLHNRSIVSACDGVGVTDKAKLKELRDLYYCYLMVYNKYDLTPVDATEALIARLDELNAFQNDLLENVLGQNSLPYQIENFKNVLKVRCEKNNGDIYRSYARVFKHTSVPVSFADVKEYGEYINRMHVLIGVQQRYLQTIDLRATIAQNSDAIIGRYGKKYKQIANTYKDVVKTVNMLPAFTTNAESVLFIENLNKFIEAQQIYLDMYAEVEEVSQRSDTIMRRCTSKGRLLSDVAATYGQIKEPLLPIPQFSDAGGAAEYEDQLEEARMVQRLYLDAIDMRLRIATNDDSIYSARRLDKILVNGYKLLRRQVDLRPTFNTVERGQAYRDLLDAQIDMQELTLATIDKLRTIGANESTITDKKYPYRNFGKAYSKMYKAYTGISEITNTEDLRRYSRQCDYIIDMQQAFMEAMRSNDAAELDVKLKRESSISKIKLILGID